MFPGAQIPDSPLGDVHPSKVEIEFSKFGFRETGDLLARLENGFHVLAGVNRLLKSPALMRDAFRPPRANRPSAC
jgi:hypothetical protein